MPYINIVINDKKVGCIELNSTKTTIGRGPDNHIRIDNPGVSASHAVIYRDGDDYVIEDLQSKNGTYINNRKISRQTLSFGDVVSIFKHRLKFVAWAGDQQEKGESGQQVMNQDGTIAVDISRIGDILAGHSENNTVRTKLISRSDNISFPLNAHTHTIGRREDCLVKTHGLLSPAISARLVLQGSDYLVIPGKPGEITLNSQPLTKAVLLKHGDELEVRKLHLRYHSEIQINA